MNDARVMSQSMQLALSDGIAETLAWRKRNNLTACEITMFRRPSINEPPQVSKSAAFVIHET
jgi:hypothetical protein